MGVHRIPQLGQLGLRIAVRLVELQVQRPFVQLVADPLQAGLALDAGVLGIVCAELPLQPVEVGDQLELDFAQECELH